MPYTLVFKTLGNSSRKRLFYYWDHSENSDKTPKKIKTNRFKGLDLIECLKNFGGLWHCRGGCDEDSPQEKEMQNDKIVVWGDHTNSWEKKRS